MPYNLNITDLLEKSRRIEHDILPEGRIKEVALQFYMRDRWCDRSHEAVHVKIRQSAFRRRKIWKKF